MLAILHRNFQLPFQYEDESMKSIVIPINKIPVTPRKTIERPIFQYWEPRSSISQINTFLEHCGKTFNCFLEITLISRVPTSQFDKDLIKFLLPMLEIEWVKESVNFVPREPFQIYICNFNLCCLKLSEKFILNIFILNFSSEWQRQAKEVKLTLDC